MYCIGNSQFHLNKMTSVDKTMERLIKIGNKLLNLLAQASRNFFH